MAATCTVTKLALDNVGANMKIGCYSILLGTTYPASTGYVLDFSADFDYIWGAAFAGNDTLADNLKMYSFIVPGTSTAVTTTNTLLTVNWSADGTDGEDFITYTDTGDLSAVGELRVIVFGV